MRIKEDKNNWKASNILRKIQELPEAARFHGKKSTHKWCRGIQGRPHDYKIHSEPSFSARYMIDIEKCSLCGKQKSVSWRRVDNSEAN